MLRQFLRKSRSWLFDFIIFIVTSLHISLALLLHVLVYQKPVRRESCSSLFSREQQLNQQGINEATNLPVINSSCYCSLIFYLINSNFSLFYSLLVSFLLGYSISFLVHSFVVLKRPAIIFLFFFCHVLEYILLTSIYCTIFFVDRLYAII